MKIDYPVDFILRLSLRIFCYILAESVVMVSTLQSLGINVKEYCDKYSLLLLDSDPLANPLLSIGILNLAIIIAISWDVLTEKYVHKGEL